ncbi:MAG TPA: NADH-quinone oxidoreductase subunit C [Actinomycetes bacterium]
MTAVSVGLADRLASAVGGTTDQGYGDVTVDVEPGRWVVALTAARDDLGLTFFDWLSAVDELAGFSVVCHLVDPVGHGHLMVRTRIPVVDSAGDPVVDSATAVYAGAAWHERETHEMFGIDFRGHPGLRPLLLPDGFEGRPLRKDFVLTARTEKEWPGAKKP